MDVSSNKCYFIDLKANEALTGVTTRFTDNENFNNFEKKVETYVSKILNSKNSKDDNSDIFKISFIGKKSNRSKSEKSENSSVSDIEDEKSKGISNEANSDKIDYSNNYDIINNMDMNNTNEFQFNNNEILDNNNLINNQNVNHDLINNQNTIQNIVNNQNTNQNLINNQNQSQNIQNKTNKIQENIRLDNIIKELLKKPMNIIKKVIERIINKKFYLVNLDDIFGSCLKQNRAALELHIYEILYFNKDNKKILLEAEMNLSEEDNEIFNYLVTRKFKFIFEKYIKNEKEFVINNKKITIDEFKTLDEVIKEKKNKKNTKENSNKNDKNKVNNNGNVKKRKPYDKKYSEAKIEEFEKNSKNFLKNINNGYLSERNNRKNMRIFFTYETIKKFDDIIKKENEND